MTCLVFERLTRCCVENGRERASPKARKPVDATEVHQGERVGAWPEEGAGGLGA